jgi:YVTN family beta-propeller protein
MRRSLIAIALALGMEHVHAAGAAYVTAAPNRVYVLDMDTHQLLTTITVGTSPEPTVSDDGTTIYIANSGGLNVSIIEAVLGQVIATVTVGGAPILLALGTDNSKLYTTNTSDIVNVIDTATYQIIATITVIGAREIVASPSNMYVGSISTTNIVVISQSTQAVIATITVGDGPFNLYYSSPRVYSVNVGSDNISIINPTTNQVVATVTVGAGPQDIGIVNNFGFVTSSNDTTVSVINTVGSPPAVVATITIDEGSLNYVAASDVQQKAFIFSSGSPAAFISVINPTPPFPIIATISLGATSIREVNMTPDESQIYVTFSVPTLNIVDTVTYQVIATITIPSQPNDVVFGLSPILPTPSGSIQMPTFVRGAQTKNEFLGQTELVNVLTWAPPSSGATPVTYLVYRNPNLTDLAGTVPASGALQFSDHSRRKKVTYIYYIVSVDSSGTRSAPAILAVAP